MRLQLRQGLIQHLAGLLGQDLHGQGTLRLHPAGDFIVYIACGAGDEDEKQDPAHHQTDPGMQPCHTLAK